MIICKTTNETLEYCLRHPVSSFLRLKKTEKQKGIAASVIAFCEENELRKV